MAKTDPKTKKPKKNSYHKVGHAHEPRSRFLKRVLMYSAFAVLTIVLSVLIFYRAKGYTFTKNGQVEKRGIVLIDSAPVSAEIFIDGRDIGKRTDHKLEISEGDHALKLEADGYRTWQTSFNIKSQQVKWFYYPYLIPDSLSPQNVQENIPLKSYSSLNSEGEVMAVSKSGAGRSQSFNLELLNLKESEPTKITSPVLVPTQLFSRQEDGTLGQIAFGDWSPDGSSIFLTHSFSGKNEIINIRLNSLPESSNLTNSIGANITEFRYDDKSRLYILNAGEYALYNPSNLTKESTIDTGVLTARNFKDDKYVYAKNPVNPGEVGIDIYLKEAQNVSKKVTNITSGTAADLDFEYTINRRLNYLSISNVSNKELLIYKDPLKAEGDPEPLFLSTFNDLKSASILASLTGSPQPGSFIALQLSAKSIFIYSFDDETSLTYDVREGDKDLDISGVSWIDSHRLQAKTTDGNIYYLDYDGNYLNQITKTDQPFSFFLGGEDKTVVLNTSPQSTQTLSQIKFKN